MPDPKPSLLRRLKLKTSSALSLAAPRRAVPDFQISLRDPHRAYAPTSLVRGSVHLTIERALAITHLTVALLGRVALNPKTDASDVETFARDEVVLSGQGRLEPGVYEFQFELEFLGVRGRATGGLPTSVDFERGAIYYSVEATLTRPTPPHTLSAAARVRLIETLDIAHLTLPKPHTITLPALTTTITLHTPGVLPGERVQLSLTASQPKPTKPLPSLIITLFRQTRFDAAVTDSKQKLPAASTFRKDLSQLILPLLVDTPMRPALRMPSNVFPTIRNVPGGAVEFRYFVEVCADLGGRLRGVGGDGEAVRVEMERRRGKRCVVARFEVVVGSVDSGRGVGRTGGERREAEMEAAAALEEEHAVSGDAVRAEEYATAPSVHDIPLPEAPPEDTPPSHPAPEYTYPQHDPFAAAPPDDKAAALLPSAPPGADDCIPEASAPDLSHEAEVAPMYERGAYGR